MQHNSRKLERHITSLLSDAHYDFVSSPAMRTLHEEHGPRAVRLMLYLLRRTTKQGVCLIYDVRLMRHIHRELKMHYDECDPIILRAAELGILDAELVHKNILIGPQMCDICALTRCKAHSTPM